MGVFHWHTTTSTYDLNSPPPVPGTLTPGDLFVHTNTGQASETTQVWLYNNLKHWEDISDIWAEGKLLVHPTFSDRVLTIRDDQTPNWVMKSTFEQKQRKLELDPEAASSRSAI